MKKLFKRCRKELYAKPCPHCGTYFPKPELWKRYPRTPISKKYNLYCPHCHWTGALAYTIKGAIIAWNDDIERIRLKGEVIEK